MKLSTRSQVIALAVLTLLATDIANAQRSTNTRRGDSRAETRARSEGTAAQSNRLNNGSSTAAPTTGSMRRQAPSAFGSTQAPAAAAPRAAAPRAAAPQAPRASTSARSSNAAPAVSTEVSSVVSQLASTGLDSKLGSDSSKLAQVLSQNADLLVVAKEILATNASKTQLSALNQSRVEGLMNLANVSASLRNTEAAVALPKDVKEQAFAALVIHAGREAANWPQATQKNMVDLLDAANLAIRQGKSVEEAMDIAVRDLKTNAKVDIKLEDIKRLCKKA